MEPKRTAKWIAHYRLLTGLAAVAGLVVTVAGFWLGLSGVARVLFSGGAGNPLQLLSEAVAAAQPLPLLVGLVLGVLVWRLGQAVAYYETTRKVVDDRVDEHLEAKLGPAIEEELERQVEFRVEAALANRGDDAMEDMFADSEPTVGGPTPTPDAAGRPDTEGNGQTTDGGGPTTDGGGPTTDGGVKSSAPDDD